MSLAAERSRSVMSMPSKIKDRYEVRTVLGRGGMGTVYRAFDTVFRREVAVKMLNDVHAQVLVDLFHRESSALAALAHPNVIEIFDMGLFEEGGLSRPYFVMPLLVGKTLHDLLYPQDEPLPVARCVDIICQASRGLQAAHDRGLLHRDVKPRNIFVMSDDSVKLIDFGLAQFVDTHSAGLKGTLQYMAPEQIRLKPLSNRSDIFSLGTACYEALTAVQPFWRSKEEDVVKAVTEEVPPLASEACPGVSRAVAQVVARAMAKEPPSRFASVAEFANELQKAWRNEPARVLPHSSLRARLDIAQHSFDEKDYQFASEILNELQAEGHADEQLSKLRQSVSQAIHEQSTGRLLENAKRCLAEEEYSLALRKVQEVLAAEPEHSSALNLKQEIEDALKEQKVAELLRAATEHFERMAFTSARQAVQDALKLRPNELRAKDLLHNIEAKQNEVVRNRQEQERLIEEARKAWSGGDLSVAIERLDQLADLVRRSPGGRDWSPDRKELERKVRDEHKALQADLTIAHQKLNTGDIAGARALYERHFARFRNEPRLRSLGQKLEEAQRQQVTNYVEDVKRRTANERDVTEQAKILDRALRDHPDQASLREQRDVVRQRQSEANAVVERARKYETEGSYGKALEEWRKLEAINPGFPSLAQEIQRLSQADQHQHIEIQLAKVRELFDAGRFGECRKALQEALEIAGGDPNLEKFVFRCLTNQAERIVETDWRAAEAFIEQGTELRGSWQPPSALQGSIAQKREEERQIRSFDNKTADETRRSGAHHGNRQYAGALAGEDAGATNPPKSIEDSQASDQQAEKTLRQLTSLKALVDDPKNTSFLEDYFARCRSLAAGHQTSQRVKELAQNITEEILTYQAAQRALAEGNHAECLRICDQFLHGEPGNRLFLSLQLQARQPRRAVFEQSGANRAVGLPEPIKQTPQWGSDSVRGNQWRIVRYINSIPRSRLLIAVAALVVIGVVSLMLRLPHWDTKKPTLATEQTPVMPPVAQSSGVPPKTPQDDTGTLVVNSDVEGADIILDGQKYSQKTVKGSIRIPLKVAQHEIEVKRNGYSGNGVVKADIVKGTDTAVVFNLSAQPATLEIRGAAEGTLVQVNGITLGTTAAEGVFSRKIRSGDLRIELSKSGFAPVELQRRCEPGQVVQLVGPSVVLTPISATPEELEARDWARIEVTGSEADFKEFLKKYPNGPDAASATARIEEYEWNAVDKASSAAVNAFLDANPNGANAEKARQTLKSIKESEAKQAEQAAWEALDKNNKKAVQAFIDKYPNQGHSKAAQELVQQIEMNEDAVARNAAAAEEKAWRSLDKRDRSALEQFLKDFPAGNHSEEARKALRALNDE